MNSLKIFDTEKKIGLKGAFYSYLISKFCCFQIQLKRIINANRNLQKFYENIIFRNVHVAVKFQTFNFHSKSDND